jgi:hypothetical protein
MDSYLKPISRDEWFEGLDKNSMQYRYEERRRMCILCLNQATQMMCYQTDGCMKIERYCDECASKMTNQSGSGI